MGQKKGNLIFILFLLHLVVAGQTVPDYKRIDSLTYACYISGDWDNLIKTGKDAIQKGIDYKFLRQRLGYAYFSKGDYFESGVQFANALSFDSYNSFSLEYLYYSYINTGYNDYTGVLMRKFSPEIKQRLSLRAFVPLESIELEYDFKYAAAFTRSNPRYYRVGINTKLGYGLTLYQSLSDYKQEIRIAKNNGEVRIADKQPEYFALLKWNSSNHLVIKTGYHFINSISGTSLTKGNLILFAIAPVWNRLNFEAAGSALRNGQKWIYQASGQTSYVFPGRLNFSLTGSASGLFQQGAGSLIYNQKAGFKFSKRAWIEGNVTFGRINNYNDFDGLYIYNSFDPITFRTGATFSYFMGRKIQLWANLSYEQKEFFENSSLHYNQFSYLGGIKWKP